MSKKNRHDLPPPTPDVLIIGMVKKTTGERFLFMFPDTEFGQEMLLQKLGYFAMHKDIDFSWEDATTCSFMCGNLRAQKAQQDRPVGGNPVPVEQQAQQIRQHLHDVLFGRKKAK